MCEWCVRGCRAFSWEGGGGSDGGMLPGNLQK